MKWCSSAPPAQFRQPAEDASLIAGRYSLDREIGRGGTGPVWLGFDETLQRRVAMKRIGLLPGADQTDLARAEREARLSAQIQDPHVVAAYDVAIDDDGLTHWLIMEYVDGPSLGERIKEHGRLLPSEARPILRQVASALATAHAAGIVHRDVKPSNILIDPQGQAKLTDFGIARIANDPTLTQTGLLTGSPAYLSPEVAGGAQGDASSDVWSFGATAFHMLAGKMPYDVSGNVLGGLYKIVNDDPPRLAEAGSLAPLLEGTMTKDPAQRWSMKQVLDFLEGDATPEAPLGATAVMAAPAPNPAPEPNATQAIQTTTGAGSRRAERDSKPVWPWAVGLLLALLLIVVIWQALPTGGDGEKETPAGPSPSLSPSPTETAAEEEEPTVEGMETFIGDYVDAIATDPAKSWPMLTPKFQRQSGGFEDYRNFWEGATDGRISNIKATPEDLKVSYQVKWTGHDNGPRTKLQLVFEDGKYLIDGEDTKGFTPKN